MVDANPPEVAPATAGSPEAVTVLHLQHVSKTFPGTRALIDAELEVRAGEVHALVGQNGSGKSTLIKILAGFHTPDPGFSSTVRDTSFDLGNAAAAHAAGLRFVHQDLGLVETLDCVDNLALGFGYATGRGGRIRWRQQRAAARAALGRVGNHEIAVNRPVGRLSAFDKTAVAIVRAVQDWENGVSLLALDEPTATMPKPEVDRLFGLIRRVAAADIGVLLVSHHLDEVFAIADRVTVLRDGSVVGTYRVADLSHSELVELMTGGAVDEVARGTGDQNGEVVLQATQLGGAVLRDFDLELHRGEIVGIAGLDGSGREEVCELIFGARRRTGTVAVDGKPLEPERPDLAIASGLGLVPANRVALGLIMTDSVRENLTLVDLSAFWHGGLLSRRRERRDTRSWIEKLGIRTASMDAVVASLSGGNQQKVVMGKWLRTSPAVLLLDEPTQGVDVGAQAELHKQVRAAADNGAAVLLCSSDERELSNVCDRVIVLCDGTVEAELTGDRIAASRIAQTSLRSNSVPAAAG